MSPSDLARDVAKDVLDALEREKPMELDELMVLRQLSDAAEIRRANEADNQALRIENAALRADNELTQTAVVETMAELARSVKEDGPKKETKRC